MTPLETLIAGWYNAFYAAAVAVAAGWTLRAGLRQGWPTGRWGLAVLAWIVGGVVGALVPGMVLGDLAAARTSIGAITFATIALALSAQALRLPTREVLDTTAVAIPLGGAVVRIGCFVAGCCRGVVTDLPLGVALHPDEELRHPVQLYESVLNAALALILWRSSGTRRPGESIVAGIGGLAAIRFATEFLRDSGKLGYLSLAQWIALPVVVICVLRLLRGKARRQLKANRSAFARKALAVAGAAVIGLAISRRLPPLETATLTLASIAAVTLIVRRSIAFAPTGITLMALQMPPVAPDSTFPRRYNFFGIGMVSGSYDTRLEQGDCDGTFATADWTRHHTFNGAAVEAGIQERSTATLSRTFRARGYLGTDRAGRAVVTAGTPRDPGGYTQQAFGVSLAGDIDRRNVGFTVGATVGQMYPADGHADEDPVSAIPFMPALGLRVGALHGASLELRLGDELPTWAPAPMATLAFGLGDSRGNRLRVGALDVGGLFVTGHYTNRQGFEIRPSIVLAPGGSDELNLIQGGIMLRKWIRVEPRPPAGR